MEGRQRVRMGQYLARARRVPAYRDHSGPDLAALQFAAALKMTVCAALLAALANPFHSASQPGAYAAANAFLDGLAWRLREEGNACGPGSASTIWAICSNDR